MKFIAYLICYILYPFSYLFPRSKRKYAFGSFRGAFNDNAKYLFIYASQQHHNGTECVWLSQNRKTVAHVRQLGLKSYNVFSPKGMWFALTSKYWFVNSYSNDIFFSFSGGVTLVNLWHGLPIKRIEFGITSGDLAKRYVDKNFWERYYHPQVFVRPDYVLSSSPSLSKIFAKDFRINQSQCLEFGYPRNYLLRCSAEQRKSWAAKYEPSITLEVMETIRKHKKCYIYMPTWRDSQRDVFVQSMNLDVLNQQLSQNDELLLLKPHANTLVDNVAQYSNILLLDSKLDVYSLLPDIDVLITDYSSIIQDYLLIGGRGVILYLYDYEEYAHGRDFEVDFDSVMPGVRAYNFESLLDAMRQECLVPENDLNRFLDFYWGESVQKDASAEILHFVQSL